MTDQLNDLAPGDARCPGPSTREVILRDHFRAPDPLLEERYVFEGDFEIPFENYTSREYAQAEFDKLWGRTWQWACREEHIPVAGDYYVYDIGHRSALVVRSDDGTIKAYHNFCRHRGTQLKPSMTIGRSKQFRCPFHGWTWNLDGNLVDLPCRWDFPHVTDESAKLPEIRVETWGGWVFVNFDDNAAPLLDYLGPLVRHFEHWPLDDRYIESHARKILPANWKAAMEAFLEAYHVLETHSQAIAMTGDANAQYDILSDNITRFIHTVGFPSPHIPEAKRADDEQMVEMLFRRIDSGERPELPEGWQPRDLYSEHLKQVLGEQYDRDFSHLSTSEVLDSIEYFVFPNVFFFPGLDKSMCYRFRPDAENPDRCVFDLLILRPKPASRPAPKPPAPHDLDIDDSYVDTPNLSRGLAMVYDQDTSNMKAQTKGFKGSPRGAQVLGNYQESRARHLHVMVERYLNDDIRS